MNESSVFKGDSGVEVVLDSDKLSSAIDEHWLPNAMYLDERRFHWIFIRRRIS